MEKTSFSLHMHALLYSCTFRFP